MLLFLLFFYFCIKETTFTYLKSLLFVKFIRILLLIMGVLYVDLIYADTHEIKLARLRKLFDMNITNTMEFPLDSVINWCNDVSPVLLDSKEYDRYFEVQFLLVNAYCTRGDISLGADLVNCMLEEAIKFDSQMGIKLSGIGIADTYTYSNMLSEAIASYKDVLGKFEIQQSLPEKSKYISIILLRLSQTLIREDNPVEAYIYLRKLNTLFSEDKDQASLYPFVLLCNASYYLKTDQPDKAKKYLDEAETLILIEPQSFRTATFYYVTSNYYQIKKDYRAALNSLELISSQVDIKLDPGRYTTLAMSKAELYLLLGLNEEATLLFQEIVNAKDSLSVDSYVRQVNALQASYEANQMELNNQKERNTQIGLILIITSIVFVLITVCALLIFKDNRRLYNSRIQLKRAKLKAENSVKIKSMILSNMSHEIRTPLNAITGFSNILIEDSIDKETRLQCNDIIQQNSALLIKLINDVNDISNLNFGAMTFNIVEHDIIKICGSVTNTVDKIKQTSAALKFETTINELIIETDESRLQQVLFNLLINATKFTAEGYITLGLSVDAENNKVLFTVTDTGCGISPENQEKIFKRFEKLNEQVQGTGLGLSICQLIITEMGGEIWIDTSYKNGSRFCFTHPIKSGRRL